VARIEIEPWEPEETVGKLWHAFASRLDAPAAHQEAAVSLAEVGGRLAVFFRALGGRPGTELRAVGDEVSRHRISLRRRLGTDADHVPRASFDGEVLRLPERLAVFPSREANGALYLWLAALLAHAPRPQMAEDPLQNDLLALRGARHMEAATLAGAPGLGCLRRALAAGTLHLRRGLPRLPPAEADLEAVILHLLGAQDPLPPTAQAMLAAVNSRDPGAAGAFGAPRGYRPFRPVPIWPELREHGFSARTDVETRAADPADEPPAEEGGGRQKHHRARRRRAERPERRDSLILHKFEAILSWAQFLNLNRRVDDEDDPDNARKAADDQEELALAQVSKTPATRLKLHLDLAPEDVARERLSDVVTYPEWDARAGSYLPDHVRVLSSTAEPAGEPPAFRADPRARRRIEQVRRRFEALRPGRVITAGHLDGDDLDIEAAVRLHADIRASGEGSERIWRQSRPVTRDLAVSILLDVSRSTESAVSEGRAVIDVEREALAALAWGLDACGDDFAIHAFSSLKRDRVYMQSCKDFGEAMSPLVEDRIGALRPGFYTRLGAAIRHCSAELGKQMRKRRLLLVITDGKPNDLDHYEGHHGIEDTRMAVREARRAGQSVFAVAIDRNARAWFARMFGRGGFSVIAHPDRLTAALPMIYRELVGA